MFISRPTLAFTEVHSSEYRLILHQIVVKNITLYCWLLY